MEKEMDAVTVTLPDKRWLEDELARFTYRPNFHMRIIDAGPVDRRYHVDRGEEGYRPFSIPQLDIRYITPNSYSPHREVEVQGVFAIPCHIAHHRDSAEFARWLQQIIFEIEQHESREWLRRDGRVYDDPHAIQLDVTEVK